MNSINLLPPDIKESIAQKKKNGVILGLFYRSLLLAVFVLVITTGTYLYFQKNSQKVASELEVATQSVSGYGQLEEQAAKIADKLSAIKAIEAKLNHWSGTVAEIQKVMPTGVYLSKASLNSDNKVRGELSGFAKNKEGIAALRDAMEASTYFEYVDIESASTETNPKTGDDLESFVLSFSLEKGALDE